MNFASLLNIPRHFMSSVRRFPLALFCSFGITFLVMYMVEAKHLSDASTQKITHLMMSLSLGFLISLALANGAEKFQWQAARRYGLLLIPAGFALMFYLIKPDNFSEFEWGLRYFVLALSFSFLVLWWPFFKSSNQLAYWQYTTALIKKIIITQLFAYILISGLSLALLALDKLFGVKIDGKLYAHLWIFVQGIFMPVFFLGHLATDYRIYNEEKPYPKFMKILVLYILLPIVCLYMFILYMYALKIVFTWQLPTGWVSNLVLSFSIIGLISFFLIYPLKNSDNKLVGMFFKLFFILKLPLLILLYVAILTRVNQYGLTELRYYVLLLALWLTFVSVYMIANRFKNLKIIFISFSLLALLSSFGPWGAFATSKKSQLNRFENITNQLQLLQNGKLSPSETEVSTEKIVEISSVVDYLINYHGLKTMRPYVSEEDYNEIEGISYRGDKAEKIMKLMGLRYIRYHRGVDNYEDGEADTSDPYYFNYSTKTTAVYEIAEYKYLVELNSHMYPGRDSVYELDYAGETINMQMRFKFKTGTLHFEITDTNADESHIFGFNMAHSLRILKEKYPGRDNYNLPVEALRFKVANRNKTAEIQANNFSGYFSASTGRFTNLTLKGRLLIN